MAGGERSVASGESRVVLSVMLRPVRAAWRRTLAVKRGIERLELLSRAGWGMRLVELVWSVRGRPIPPPNAVKRLIVRRAGREQGCHVFVETGTFLGGMLVANRRQFDRLISIELSPDLWQRAAARLSGTTHVTLLCGDSAALLADVVKPLAGPAVFWLDAHYSEGVTARGQSDTPILAELRAILAAPNTRGSVVLIDDARCFGQGDYPAIADVISFVAPRAVSVAHDVIRFIV